MKSIDSSTLKKIAVGVAAASLFIAIMTCSILDYMAKEREKLDKKLINAVVEGNLNDVKTFLEEGGYEDNVNVYINSSSNNKWNLFQRALFGGNSDVVKYFIDHGANIKVIDEDGWSALHLASRWGNAEIVKSLLEKGANSSSEDKRGRTPLHIASLFCRLDVVKCLVENGTAINATNDDGLTALHFATLYGKGDANKCPEVLEFLIEKKEVDVNSKTIDGMSPLDYALRWGFIKGAKVLENAGGVRIRTLSKSVLNQSHSIE